MSDRLLLDTNVVIWLLSESEKVSPRAKRALMKPSASLWVSVVSVWEIVMKHQAGKLRLGAAIEAVVDQVMHRSPWTILRLEPAHLPGVAKLPLIHKDPFDRMLIAQALHEQLTIVTSDDTIPNYEVSAIW